MADVRHYNPHQIRDPDGEWGDGVPGPGFDLDGLTAAQHLSGTFGDLAMGVDPAGDVRLAFHEGGEARELDLSPADVGEMGDALTRLAGEREHLDGDLTSDELVDDEWFGDEQQHRVALYGSGIIQVTFGAEDDDPWTLSLDPPDDEGGDDVETVLQGVDAVLAETNGRGRRDRAEARAAEEHTRPAAAPVRLPYWLVSTIDASELRRYHPDQKRDPNGEWGDGVPGASLAADVLKLADKIRLEPGETLLGSGKVDAGGGGFRLAAIGKDGGRSFRLGAGPEGYGKRDRDEGTPAWDGNPPGEPISLEDYDDLEHEYENLDAEYDSATPARQEEISARQDDIREQLAADDVEFNGTAEMDAFSMRRLADKIRPALAEAVEEAIRENVALEEIEELEASGSPDPERLAELRRIARLGATDFIVFDKGIVPGSKWGDVHFSVELDDSTNGPYVLLGVMPKDAPDDWGDDPDDQDWQGQFDAAETRKVLKLIDKLAKPVSEPQGRGAQPVFDTPTWIAGQGLRAFQPDEHPRAPTGTDTGGQFAKAVNSSKKAAATTAKRKPASKATGKPMARPRKPDDGTLAYDPQSNQGTGYGNPHGDDRVHALQQALNRLGLTDSAGKPLKDDGKLGPKTTAAVKALQTRLGLKADGKVTPALLAQVKSMKSLPAQKRSGIMAYCVRSFGFQFEERSRNADGRTLEGYAAVFNTPTRIAAVGGDFDEVITPGAFTRSIRSRMPVLQFEHGRDPRVGAVPIGAIQDLSEDSQGLHVRAQLFDNPVVEPVRQAIEGRAIKGMSFRFNVADGGDQWTRRSGNIDLRAVGDADVHELGPVVFPAYDTTTVSVRSLLAQLGPEEHRALLRELAHDLRSADLSDLTGQPAARSGGSGETGAEPERNVRPAPHLHLRQRLDDGALRARGILL